MLKHFYTCLGFVLVSSVLSILPGCRKDEEPAPVEKEVIFTGRIVQKFTNKPVPNIEVQPRIYDKYSSNVEAVGDAVLTNPDGEFEIHITKDQPEFRGGAVYNSSGFDSSQMRCQVLPQLLLFENNPTVELDPSGRISFTVAESVWSQLPADSVTINSPYSEIYEIDKQQHLGVLYVLPSQSHVFTYKAFYKGELKSVKTETIYVPNYFQPQNTFSDVKHIVQF